MLARSPDTNKIDPTSPNSANDDTVYRIAPAYIIKIFAVFAALIAVVGSVSNYSIYHVFSPDDDIAKVLNRFDLGHEPSIPNYYSAVAILICALLLFLIGNLRRTSGKTSWQWHALGIVFVCLSIDEAVLFHELANAGLEPYVKNTGVLFLPWVIAGAVFSIAVAVFFLPFLLELPARTRNLMIVAGVIFVSGALGMEMVASLIFSQAGSEEVGVQLFGHTISQSIEESLEMAGIIVFLYALLDYLSSNFTQITFRFEKSDLGDSK